MARSRPKDANFSVFTGSFARSIKYHEIISNDLRRIIMIIILVIKKFKIINNNINVLTLI